MLFVVALVLVQGSLAGGSVPPPLCRSRVILRIIIIITDYSMAIIRVILRITSFMGYSSG